MPAQPTRCRVAGASASGGRSGQCRAPRHRLGV